MHTIKLTRKKTVYKITFINLQNKLCNKNKHHILLSDINYLNKKYVGNIGIDVSTNIHVIIRIQFKL